MANLSSGTTAVATSGGVVTAVANSGKQFYNLVRVHNTGAEDGFVSWDGGNTKHYLPANFVSEFNLGDAGSNREILIYPESTDMTGLYVTAL